MKRPRPAIRSYSGLLLAGAVLFQITFLPAQNIPIAVMDFDGRGISDIEAAALTDRLRNELFRLGAFEVVERGMMETILTEQDFQMTGCTSNECLVEVGRLLGARQIVGGSISKVGGTFTVSARLVDVETGKVLGVSDFDLRGELDDMLTQGMRQVAMMLSGEEVSVPEQVVQRQVQQPRPIGPAPARTYPLQAVIGIPIRESGIGFEVSKFVGGGWPLGAFMFRPAIAGGGIIRASEDTDEYYEDIRAYFSLAAHGLMEGRTIQGGVHIGFGLSVGEYYEEYYGTPWDTSGMEMIFTLGAQARIRVTATLDLVGDARIVHTPTYESSLFLQVGLQR